MKRFAVSVQHITGQELEVKALSDTDSMTVVEQELESLRTKVEELSDEVCLQRNLSLSFLVELSLLAN
jgi:diaphanous 1